MTIYHISGHLDMSFEEFEKHYVPSLEKAVKEDASFVVGDAKGVDAMAQQWLKNNNITKVTVYHMFKRPRNNKGNWKTIGGFKTDESRDEAMTKNSDEDIAWVRSIEEQKKLYGSKYRYRISGTEKNLIRRKKYIELTN